MRAISPLQIGLIIAGILLVIGVLVYNAWQMRRLRSRMDSARRGADGRSERPDDVPVRLEPTLSALQGDAGVEEDVLPPSQSGQREASSTRSEAEVAHDPDWRAPMEPLPPLPDDTVGGGADDRELDSPLPADGEPSPSSLQARAPRARFEYAGTAAAPDADIECIVTIQPATAGAAGALAAGLHARLAKPVRWFGRREPDGAWQRIAGDARGEYTEFAVCMLLADRNGPASDEEIGELVRLGADVASLLPGAYVAPDIAAESERAQALDRLCAELDIQIGLTIQKRAPGTVAGTRLRGVVEAAGFRLAPNGRFEWVQEETGAVLFTLQSVTDEPFTLESLRLGSVSGVVFVLDVPRVGDPPRAFDQMKLAAKRMAQTLDGEVVDDNRRLLNDAGFAAIRAQVVDATATLRRNHIEPGSPRALKLFAT